MAEVITSWRQIPGAVRLGMEVLDEIRQTGQLPPLLAEVWAYVSAHPEGVTVEQVAYRFKLRQEDAEAQLWALSLAGNAEQRTVWQATLPCAIMPPPT